MQGKSKGPSGSSTARGAAMRGARDKAVRVRSKSGRSLSSMLWLNRQLNDPYVAEAKRQGYRSRAAYKLIELDDRFHVLKRGAAVIDLGAAPGGWTQVAVARAKSDDGGPGRVVGIDLLPMDPIPGAVLLQGDFLAEDAPRRLTEALGRPADVVLTDMAPSATGHAQTDHLRIMNLLEAAVEFAAEVLAPGGAFVGKVLQGGAEASLLARLKRDFTQVRHAKPPASRKDSAELYLVATGFRKR
ncbi:MAG: RlmE family RNA methyltransferase [Alphaproteobacteria bacterium]|nr:RlmE family RNA methyltransferase [Alphaproteobacteria bacterium]